MKLDYLIVSGGKVYIEIEGKVIKIGDKFHIEEKKEKEKTYGIFKWETKENEEV